MHLRLIPVQRVSILLIVSAMLTTTAVSQGDCTTLNVQQLASDYLSFGVDTVILQPDGSYEVQLSNGTTASITLGCTDPAYVEYDATANTDDGSCATLPSTCVSPTMDGYSYSVVEIGDQCWFAENLRTENYTNGDAIPTGLSGSDWSATQNGAVAVYGEGNTSCYDATSLFDVCDEAVSLDLYGRMYNWHAVNDTRGLCPNGWHVPTDEEWTQLGNQVASISTNSIGIALKAESGWWNDGNGTDEFGFSALPAGARNDDSSPGAFVHTGTGAAFWSSTSSGGGAWYRGFDWGSGTFFRTAYPSKNGYSARCLRDAD